MQLQTPEEFKYSYPFGYSRYLVEKEGEWYLITTQSRTIEDEEPDGDDKDTTTRFQIKKIDNPFGSVEGILALAMVHHQETGKSNFTLTEHLESSGIKWSEEKSFVYHRIFG